MLLNKDGVYLMSLEIFLKQSVQEQCGMTYLLKGE